MARVKLIQNKEDIAPEHHALFDELAALRGRISGPSTVVLHSPGLAKPWNDISEYLHRESIVEAAAAELAVSATAREKDCPYIWNAHVPQALKAGVARATIDAVRDRRPLDGLPAQEALVVEYVRQLMQRNRVDQDVFDKLLQAHDPQWLVELTVWIGRYAALAGILNGFEVAPEDPKEPLPMGPSPSASGPRPLARKPLPQPRLPMITAREQLAEAGRPVFDAVAEGRGTVRGPFSILLYSPPLCQRVLDVGTYLRFNSVMPRNLIELATIAAARDKDCPYVWAAHVTAARKDGAGEAAIAAVRDHGDTSGLAEDERDVVDYVRQQLRTNRVSQELFDRLSGRFGIPWLVELTALIGHYGIMASILNAFEVAPAAGAEQLPLA